MKLTSEFETICPCCQATLVIDGNLRRIVRHEEPVRGDRPELSDASASLPTRLRGAKRSFSSRSPPNGLAATRCRNASKKRCGRPTRNRSPSRRGISIWIEAGWVSTPNSQLPTPKGFPQTRVVFTEGRAYSCLVNSSESASTAPGLDNSRQVCAPGSRAGT